MLRSLRELSTKVAGVVRWEEPFDWDDDGDAVAVVPAVPPTGDGRPVTP